MGRMTNQIADCYRDTDPKAIEVFLELMLFRLAEDSVRREYPKAGSRV
jgi:hypothetical protein